MQSKYQLGVIYFDALGLQKPDYVSKIVDNVDLAEFTSVYASLWSLYYAKTLSVTFQLCNFELEFPEILIKKSYLWYSNRYTCNALWYTFWHALFRRDKGNKLSLYFIGNQHPLFPEVNDLLWGSCSTQIYSLVLFRLYHWPYWVYSNILWGNSSQHQLNKFMARKHEYTNQSTVIFFCCLYFVEKSNGVHENCGWM